jgi:hypothetical protein
MCRNITPLRGLEPPASSTEMHAAALQFVRKVGSFTTVPVGSEAIVGSAVDEIAGVVARLLAELPARRVAPAVEPPLRRRAAGSSSPRTFSRARD